ncbi:MAG: hypothetical protein HY043_15765 [Verrucomicrobia bacterium]|nr:hypothetical protein [Verrucomicrobiota bacterium]
MQIKLSFLTLFIGLAICFSAFGNRYDDEERIRRALERAKQQEQAERAAARERVDREEREQRIRDSGGNPVARGPTETNVPVVVLVCVIAGTVCLGFPIWLAVDHYRMKAWAKEPHPAFKKPTK